jgi:hypothetical protein
MQKWLQDKSLNALDWPSQSRTWARSSISGETWKSLFYNLFLLCDYGVLCVDWWGGKTNYLRHFRIRL